MDPRTILTTFQVEHRHSDGSLGRLVEDRPHLSSADHDPERAWDQRRIFRCVGCDEEVSIVVGDPGETPTEH